MISFFTAFAFCLKSFLRLLKRIEQEFRLIPFPLLQILYVFSAQFVLNSKFLNYLGIQKFRIRLSDFSLSRRRNSLKFNFLLGSNLALSKYYSNLHTDGILRVNNALPSVYINRASSIVSNILSNQIPHKSFVKAGAEYREVVVSEADPLLYNFLVHELWVGNVVKTYLAKKRLKQEWRIKLVRDFDGTFDNNTLWHSDIFFSTLKVFIYLNSVPKEQDVFQYVETSHVMSASILDLHYRYSRNQCRQPWPSLDEVSKLGMNIFYDDIPKNTLILSDTRGIHRRHPKQFDNSDWRATLFCSFRSSPLTSF